VKIHIFHSIEDIGSEHWKPLEETHFPFSDYDFLWALEKGQCLGKKTGWIPRYITAWERGKLLGACFLYIKDNSYGEYIFDWQWAEAYHQHEIAYFPKIVSSIPFTPATGKKFLLHPHAPKGEIEPLLIQSALEIVAEQNCSSCHFLFIPEEEIPFLEDKGFLIRHSHQFHWQNKGYDNFQDFLGDLKRKKRAHIMRERKSIRENSSLVIQLLSGKVLQQEHAEIMHSFYLKTIEQKGAIAYLTPEFFENIFKTMRDKILLVLAKDTQSQRWVAGTLNFFKGNSLYGRYWGSDGYYKNLHFELCYYQTIEYAIQKHFLTFEAGAQGFHKVPRGFLPQIIYSAHWIGDPQFRSAIANFIEMEKKAIAQGLEVFSSHSPLKLKLP
jgi:hypothetical protein